MAYALLLAFVIVEYVRPASYVPSLDVLKLNSLIPLSAFVVTLLRASPQTIQRVFTDRVTAIVLGLYLLVWLSFPTADVQQRAWDAQMILLGYIIIYSVVASEVTSLAKVKGIIKMLILAHLIVAALNPELLLNPGQRHYISSGSFLGDGNDFALSLDIIIPLCLFLVVDAKKVVFKWTWIAALAVLVAGVVSTQSRGGTLGLAATGLYYWAKSARRAQIGLIGAAAVAAILALAPGAYFDRMSTIGDTNEGSAQGRITAWTAAVRMALDNPVFGVGAAHFGVKIGTEYRPQGFIGSGMNAHSLYFLALGELGIPGLVVVIWLISANLSANRRVSDELIARGLSSSSSELQLLASTSAAMIALATAGAFLSILYYPHLYVLSGVMVVARHVVLARAESSTSAAAATAIVGRPASVHWSLQGGKPAWNAQRGDPT
jgi:probable O-glycosylation ligase (exosortase A-associated)